MRMTLLAGTSLAALALLAALAPSAAAQPAFSQSYVVHVGNEDISTTPVVEGIDHRWTVTQTLGDVPHSADAPSDVRVHWPSGQAFLNATCDACTSVTQGAGFVTFHVPATADPVRATLSSTGAQGNVPFAVGLVVDDAWFDGEDAAIVVYAPGGFNVLSFEAPKVRALPCTDRDCSITTFEGAPGQPVGLTYAIVPAGLAPADTVQVRERGFGWMELAAGAVAGMAVWALLVARGAVQRRSRKQVRQQATHEALAAAEAKPVLEGRRRALLAALKELELANMNKEIEPAAYDAVKADFKRQAVTVLRALEGAEAPKE